MCLTFWRHHRRNIFHDRLLRRIFVPKSAEVRGDLEGNVYRGASCFWLTAKYIENDPVKKYKVCRNCSRQEKKRNPYMFIVGEPERSVHLGDQDVDG
jgi:hypothetical protein